MTWDRRKNKNEFEYKADKGNREASVLGSYNETLTICKIDNGKAAEYIFDVCAGAGFDRKTNGYSTYIMRALRDIYRLYAKDNKKTKDFLIKEFRQTTPVKLKAEAVTKYPMLDYKGAVSLYVEDLIVDNLGLKQSRKAEGTRLVSIEKKTA